MTLIVILLSFLTLVQASSITYKTLEKWQDGGVWTGFKGSFTIHFTSEKSGWKAHLIFNQAVEYFQIFAAKVTTVLNGKREFVVQNQDYNNFVHRDMQIEMEVLGHVKGTLPPEGWGYIEKADDQSTKTSPYVERTSNLRTTETTIPTRNSYSYKPSVFNNSPETTAVSFHFTSIQNSKESKGAQYPQSTLTSIQNQSSKPNPVLATIQAASNTNKMTVSCDTCENFFTSNCSRSFHKCSGVCMTQESVLKLTTKCVSTFECRYQKLLEQFNEKHTECCWTNECFLHSLSLAIQNYKQKMSISQTTKHVTTAQKASTAMTTTQVLNAQNTFITQVPKLFTIERRRDLT